MNFFLKIEGQNKTLKHQEVYVQTKAYPTLLSSGRPNLCGQSFINDRHRIFWRFYLPSPIHTTPSVLSSASAGWKIYLSPSPFPLSLSLCGHMTSRTLLPCPSEGFQPAISKYSNSRDIWNIYIFVIPSNILRLIARICMKSFYRIQCPITHIIRKIVQTLALKFVKFGGGGVKIYTNFLIGPLLD